MQNLEIRDSGYVDQEYDGVINSLALGLIDLSQNTAFRQYVHNKVALHFDGDDNVLFRDLFPSNAPYSRSSLTSSILNHYNQITLSAGLLHYYSGMPVYTSAEKLDSMIEGYRYNNTTIYPQIYIPYFESVDKNQSPTIVIYYDEFTDDIIPGYQLQADGSVKLINVDSTYAKSNLVWVISVNETVDSSGQIPPSGPIGPRSESKIVQIKKIKLKLRFDNTWGGQAEVTQISAHLLSECINNHNHVFTGTFLKAKHRDLWYTVSDFQLYLHQLFSNADYLTTGEYLHLLIYEQDPPRRKNENIYTVVSCSNLQFKYYSKNPLYYSFNDLELFGLPYDEFSNTTNGYEEYPYTFESDNCVFYLESGKAL